MMFRGDPINTEKLYIISLSPIDSAGKIIAISLLLLYPYISIRKAVLLTIYETHTSGNFEV